jgi:hypothetical protein
MKIFKLLKTGHAATDAFFRNQAVWHDTDMTRSCVLGFCIGAVVMAFVIGLCI